ncbi:MAG: aldo/keto reductase, partial [Gemmatimonadetes bacterium]
MRTTLPTRQLGTTDLNITRVGFGAWAVGGGGWAFGWGPQDDNESIAAMNHALDLGVNWIDTAAVYGLGHSEEIVGRLLKQRKGADRPYIFTKCGLVWNPKDPMEDAKRILSP